MMIYVNGQDIARLVLGTIENGQWKLEPQVLELRPEQYLQGLEDFLRAQSIERSLIKGFVLVSGPGSATSLRTSHAMVNALAFALGVTVISVEKQPNDADIEILPRLIGLVPKPFALPVYAHAPTITQTNRDALKRKAI
jgi:hypothetical protein